MNIMMNGARDQRDIARTSRPKESTSRTREMLQSEIVRSVTYHGLIRDKAGSAKQRLNDEYAMTIP